MQPAQPIAFSTKQLLEIAELMAKTLTNAGLVGPIEPELASYETTSRMLECCPESVRNLANRGELERVWIGTGAKGAPRITLKSVRAYITKKTECAPSAPNHSNAGLALPLEPLA